MWGSHAIRAMNVRRGAFAPGFSLYLGDCIEILRRLPDRSVNAIVTDPPYGINYKSKRHERIANDQRPFIWWLGEAYRVARKHSALICFSSWRTQEAFKFAIEVAGWKIKSHVVWDKKIHGMGDLKRQFAPQHEVIWYATKGDVRFPGHRPKSVQTFTYIFGSNRVHPNQKPIDLMVSLLEAITKPGQTVLDCFAGSGSTGIACVKTGRKFIGVESDPDYFDIAQGRIIEAMKYAA